MLEDRTLLSGTPITTLQLLPAAGQNTPAAVTFELNSFKLGFHKQAGGTAAVSFDALDVTAPYTANSPLLFRQLTKGQAYPSAMLTQKDAGGNTVGVWALNNVRLTDDAITGSGNGLPGEELKFAFGALAQSVGTHIAGWSQVNKSSSSSDIPSVLDRATPAVAPTRVTLDLSGGNATPVSIDLNTFQFGIHNSTTVGPTGVVAGTTSFDKLDVTATLSAAAPDLFAALTSGKHYGTVTLKQYDAAGNPAAVWVLGQSFVTDDIISGSAGALPTQEVKFAFGALAQSVGTNIAGWSQVTNSSSSSDIPIVPDPATPAVAPTGLTLNLYTSTAATATPAVTLNLNTFQFGFHKAVGATAVSFDALDVTAGLSSYSPKLFAALAGQKPFASARITQTDAQGNTTGVWALSNVHLTDDVITGSGNGLPGEALRFAFGALAQSVGTNIAGWSQVSNSSSSSDIPFVLDPATPAVASTGLTLKLYTSTAATATAAVTLNLNTFRFGFHKAVGATAVSFDALDVTTGLSSYSPKLFAALAGQKPFASARITQTDAQGNTTGVWALSNVVVTDDVITGSGSGLPSEVLKFAFGALAQSVGTNIAGWSQVSNSSSSSDIPFVLDPATPAAAPTGLTLKLYTSTAATAPAAVTLNLNTFQFGFHKAVGATAVSFDALDVTAGLSSYSPKLFAALAGQKPFASARITQTDAQGNTTGVWALSNVVVTDDVITGSGTGLTGEELKFAFQAYGQGVGTHTATWDHVTNTTVDLGNLDPGSPAAAPTRITLDLAGGTATPLRLDLSTFQFVFNKPTTIGSATGGAGAGKVSWPILDVTAALSNAAPDLFAALVNHQHYNTATLTQYDSSGNPAAVWVLAPVFVTDDGLAGSGQTTQELKFVFEQLTEVTNPNRASWNFASQTATGPQGPDPSTLDPLAPSRPTPTARRTGRRPATPARSTAWSPAMASPPASAAPATPPPPRSAPAATPSAHHSPTPTTSWPTTPSRRSTLR
jgi:type VI protein secretion system component Hcp